jgi:hypothetical protein
MWAEKYAPLLRQEHPRIFRNCDTVDDYFHAMALCILSEADEDVTVLPFFADNKEPWGTIAYCEESYEQGYSAIINDGKLLGFRQEKE